MERQVKYELQAYERLLDSIERDADFHGVAPDDFRRELNLEILRTKSSLINEVFGFEDERHLERYIQYHQQALIRLMDVVLKKLDRNEESVRRLLQPSYYGLEELLYFVERHFSKYFDQDAKAPIAYVSIVRKDMKVNLAEVIQKLADLNADQELTEALLYAMRRLAESDPAKSISYQKILFAKEIQKELLGLLATIRSEADINEELRNLVYYLNYNSIKTFAYHTNYIDMLLSAADSRGNMIESLSLILKKVNQAQVKPGIAYNKGAPSLKSQLTSYILEEIDHLQRIHQFGQLGSQRPVEFPATFRIQVEMSVAQIAYLFKILIESHVIVNNNVSEFLRFLAKYVNSKKAETVSYDSLRSKYYNVEQATKDSVKNLLFKLVTSIGRKGVA